MNSSIEVSEAVTLAQKLVQRTLDGKLTWDANCIENQGSLAPTHFTTVLEGNLHATVSCSINGDMNFSLVEFNTFAANLLSEVKDYSAKEVLSVSVEKDPAYGYDTPGEKQLAGLLVDLHGLARRSALKIDGSVQKALTYLDKIAV